MLQPVVEIAPAKLNLFLEITGKRADGYHELDSLFVFASVHDLVSLTPAAHWELSIDGPFSGSLGKERPENNLVVKAAKSLTQLLGLDQAFYIQLTKNLPVAAGIGGGSADAAAALRAVLKFSGEKVPDQNLELLALRLGADVPSCLSSRAQIIRGIGEKKRNLPNFHKLHAVLVNPLTPLSTAEVFNKWPPEFSVNQECPMNPDPESWKKFILQRTNCLEATAAQLCPAIDLVLDQLGNRPGCELARMSGSGPSCFGLFPTASTAQTAAADLSQRHQNWWIKPVELS